MGGGALQELETVGEPARQVGLGQVIEDVAAFTALLDEAVGSEEAEVLGDAGVGDT